MYKILLLRDDSRQDCHIKEYLQLSGYYVEEENSESMGGVERQLYAKDLVLLNYKEADSYFGVVERLRNMTDIPIVLLTETDDEWTKIKMFQTGADDYIVEPCHSGELVARLKARIEQFQRLTRSFGYISTRDLCIGVQNRKVYLKNQEIPMTIREFDILFYLAQRPDIVVSKEELFQAMWQERYISSAYNSVAAYIKKIRRKIEPEPDSQKYIETIWGIGYRFVT